MRSHHKVSASQTCCLLSLRSLCEQGRWGVCPSWALSPGGSKAGREFSHGQTAGEQTLCHARQHSADTWTQAAKDHPEKGCTPPSSTPVYLSPAPQTFTHHSRPPSGVTSHRENSACFGQNWSPFSGTCFCSISHGWNLFLNRISVTFSNNIFNMFSFNFQTPVQLSEVFLMKERDPIVNLIKEKVTGITEVFLCFQVVVYYLYFFT